MPSRAGKHRGRLARLTRYPAPGLPLLAPTAACTRAYTDTHARTPSPGRKLRPAKSAWNSGFQRCPWPPAPRPHAEERSQCVPGAEREGASVPAHVYLGPKKNPQLAALSTATPASATFLPFLSPHWVAPANQPTPPSPLQGDPGQPSRGCQQAQTRGRTPGPKQPETSGPPPTHGRLTYGKGVLPLLGYPEAELPTPGLHYRPL